MKSVKNQVRDHIWNGASEKHQGAVSDSVFDSVIGVYSRIIDDTWMSVVESIVYDERTGEGIDWLDMV